MTIRDEMSAERQGGIEVCGKFAMPLDTQGVAEQAARYEYGVR